MIYEEAAASGQRAGLVEEERPNLFTTSLANIGPGEMVAVQIEYQDKARLDNGVWSTPFPAGDRPALQPTCKHSASTADRNGRTLSVKDPVPDRDRITPPVLHPAQEPAGKEGLRLPVNFDISLEAGVPIAGITSQTACTEGLADRQGQRRHSSQGWRSPGRPRLRPVMEARTGLGSNRQPVPGRGAMARITSSLS